MTRTEDRLRDALGAAARTVPDDAPPPGLPIRERQPSRPVRWPVLAGAAAGVVALATGVPYLLFGTPDHSNAGLSPMGTIAPDGPPPYFVSIGEAGKWATVYDARTGQQVERIPGGRFTSVAAAPDQRTFYFTVTDENCGSTIARIKVHDDGTVTRNGEQTKLAHLPGTHSEREWFDELAVAPDGTTLAWASVPSSRTGKWCDTSASDSGSVIAMDPTTGAQRAWSTSESGAAVALSWAPDSRTLGFGWSTNGDVSGQVRLLDTDEGGDLMDSRPVTEGATVDVPGKGSGRLYDLTIAARGQRALAVFDDGDGKADALVEVSLVDGSVTVVEDELAGQGVAGIIADATREHLLVVDGRPMVGSDGKDGVGRYDDGEVEWIGGPRRPWDLAW